MIKPALWLHVAFAFAFAVSALLCSAQAIAASERLDRIVAVVNEGVILQSELVQAVKTAISQVQASGTRLPPDDVIEKQVLEQLVMLRIQAQEAERSGLRASDSQVNGALTEIARDNNMELRQFRRVLEQDGFRFSLFRERIRSQILINQLHQRQVNRVKVSQHEIDSYLTSEKVRGEDDDEVQISQILVSLPEGASPEEIAENRIRAEEILSRLDAGEDFAALAISDSDGQKALEGGALGWRKPRDLP
ncbi:MAG: molecular chaperone SurA, partial [Chromatiales bacterium]|nr:molecular chaperone SurA [Chromatiales bacterium]